MSVYLKLDCWDEFVQSSLSYLHYAEIKSLDKIIFLQRTMVMILLGRPNCNKAYLPEQYLSFLKDVEINPKNEF